MKSLARKAQRPVSHAPMWTAVSRGVACFLGIVFLLDLVAIQHSPGTGSICWLLNLEPLPRDAVRILLAVSGLGLILFSSWPRLPVPVNFAVQGIIALLLCFCASNTVSAIESGSPVCLAAFTGILLIMVAPATLRTRGSATVTIPMHAILVVTVLQCAITLPLVMLLSPELPLSENLRSGEVRIAVAFHEVNHATESTQQPKTDGVVEQALAVLDPSAPGFLILVTDAAGRDGIEAGSASPLTQGTDASGNYRVVRPQSKDVSEIVRLMSRLSTETRSRECVAFVPPQISDRLAMEARQSGLRLTIRNSRNSDAALFDPDVLLSESVAIWRTMLTPVCHAIGISAPNRTSRIEMDAILQDEQLLSN